VETREDIRSLIGEVVITPGEKRGESHAVLRGELMAILDLAAGRRRTPRPEVITKELAGRGFEPIQHRSDVWEARSKGGFWQPLKMAPNKLGYPPIRK
jgi:hypothetical protein